MPTRKVSGEGESSTSSSATHLGRFGACHPCRRQKRRCDAVRPVCGPCQNPYRRTGGPCTWDERRQTSDIEAEASTSANMDVDDKDPLMGPEEFIEERRRALIPPGQPLERFSRESPDASIPYSSSLGPRPYPAQPSDGEMQRAKVDFGMMIIGARSSQNSTPSDILLRGKSRDLPSKEVIEHVVGVFFDKVPIAPHMISRSRFMADLTLPHSHPRTPAGSLIHAILAITARYLSPELLVTPAYSPSSDIPPTDTNIHELDGMPPTRSPTDLQDPLTRFESFHLNKAMELFLRHADRMNRLVDAMRAHVIISILEFFNARPSGFFTNTGTSMRIAVAMQLNESPNVPPDSWNRFNHQVIPPSLTPTEQADRDRVFWGAWLMDRHVILQGNWSSALPDDEIAVELPVPQVEYERGGDLLTGFQTLHSPDLFTNHPPECTDSFVLLIKSTVLSSAASKFLRGYSRGPHTVARYLNQTALWSVIKNIENLRRTFPPEYKQQTGGASSIDRTLLTGVWLVHATQAILGEPVVTDDWTGAFANATLWEIRAALSLLHDVMASSFDVTLFPAIAVGVWFTCSRVLCRFVDAATAAGDLASASVFTQEIRVFRRALELYSERHTYGRRNLQRLDVLLRVQGDVGDISGKLAFDTSAEENSFPVLRPVPTPHPIGSSGDVPIAYAMSEEAQARGVSLTVRMEGGQ